jgi:hypothetical protein
VLHRRSNANVTLAPLGWLLIVVLALAVLVIAFAPRAAEGPALGATAIVVLAIVRGATAERFGAARRLSAGISRHGIVRADVPGQPTSWRREAAPPPEPLAEGVDEIEQDLLFLQERQRREAAGRR